MNIVKLKCADYSIDWVLDKEIEIDVDKYIFFEVEYRGESSWHLIGHTYNEETKKWETVEFCYHICSIYNMAYFIAQVNNIPDKVGDLRNRVSRFNNLHYYMGFYKELGRLFELVERYTIEIQNKGGTSRC